MSAQNSNSTAGDFTVSVDSNSTEWASPQVFVSRIPHEPDDDDPRECWDFSFAVQDVNAEEAARIGEEIMLVLCGGGWFRHSRLGRRILGCRRVAVGSEHRRSWSRRNQLSEEGAPKK